MSYRRTQLEFLHSPSVIRVGSLPAHADQQADQERRAAAQAAENEKLAQQLEYLQQLLTDVGRAVEDMQQQQRDALTEMQQAAVELSVVAASWIVGVALERKQFAVDDLIKSMVDHLHEEQPVRVFLNADDAELLNNLKSSSDTNSFSNAAVEFVTDPRLARGMVRAETTRSRLVADMDERLADIRRIWMENLNETQTERRADDPAGRGFRRFPERRHTA